jgi:hypothetical protein
MMHLMVRALQGGPTAARSCAALTIAASVVLGVNIARAQPAGWPASIQTPTGFQDVGRAIASERGFPSDAPDVEKARFIFLRMPAVAQAYEIKSGSANLVSQAVIGLWRLGPADPENAEALKSCIGWGNCGEWSYAFSEILKGGGVNSRVAYGDSSGSAGSSLSFNGTDTIVIVDEWSPKRDKTSRRVFDAFRSAYHSGTSQPTDATIKKWGDVALTDADRWADEPPVISWQTMVGKPFVKDAGTQTVFVAVGSRLQPGPAKRPVWIGGIWAEGAVKITQDGTNVQAQYLRGRDNSEGGFSGMFDGTTFQGQWKGKNNSGPMNFTVDGDPAPISRGSTPLELRGSYTDKGKVVNFHWKKDPRT